MRRIELILLVFGVTGSFLPCAMGQGTDQVYRLIDPATVGIAADHIHSWAELSPDGRTIAISGTGSYPLLLVDAQSLTLQRSIDVGDWKAGSRASFNVEGKLLLLEEIEYLGHSSDDPQPHRFAVVDLHSGVMLVKDQRAYACALSADGRSLYSVNDDGVLATDLLTGTQESMPGMGRKGTAMAVSPQGDRIAVAHRPTVEELTSIPSVRNDKKVIKAAQKAGQVVVSYDLVTGRPVATVAELFDKIFRVEYSPGGKELWIHARPGTHKSANPDRSLSYVDVADPTTGVMGRASFPSHAIYEPTFCADPKNLLFAMGSQKGWKLEVHVYDRGSSSMLGRFVIDERLFLHQKENEEKWSDARTSFVILAGGGDGSHPGGRLLMTFGSKLIEWTYAP